MIIPLLITIGLCILPQEEKVQIKLLPNGVKTYIQEHGNPLRQGSFRVIMKKAHSEGELYRYDGVTDSMESIERFFDYCKEKASNGSAVLEGLDVARPNLPFLNKGNPSEIAVVAVGDFPSGEMQNIIEKHFGVLNLVSELNPSSSEDASIMIGIDPEMVVNAAVSLGYFIEKRRARTYRDLKEVWKSILLKDLFQQRLEICSRSLDKVWVHPYPRFFYPISGYSIVPEEFSENMLSYFLFQAETLRIEGFCEEEFQRVKHRTLSQLHYLASCAESPENGFLASYFADQFLLGDSCPSVKGFMDGSVDVVSGIQWQELLASVESFLLEKKNRYIQVAYPIQHAEMMTKADVEQMVQHASALATVAVESEADEEELWSSDDPFLNSESSILLIENAPEGTESFYHLPITDREKRLIKIIITTMAEKNILQLAFIKRTMEKKGKKIEHVHPMRFIGYILSNAELRSSLRIIKKSSFKWDAFIDGFSRRMKEEFGNNNLYVHIPGFCHQTGANPAEITHFIQKKDWEGLVKSCM